MMRRVPAMIDFVAEMNRAGNLVTSRKPDDLPAFCRAIIAQLSR